MRHSDSTRKIIGQIREAIRIREGEIAELERANQNINSAQQMLSCKRASLSQLEWVLMICLRTEASKDGWY